MNKRILLATGAAVLTLTALGGVHKANAVTDTSDAEAVIIQPITVDCTTSLLDFGNILPSGVAGTVVVSTAGAATPAGGVTHFGGEAAGNCDVAGDLNVAADISISNIVNLDDGGPGAAMAMSNFTLDYDAGAFAGAAPLLTVTLDPAGAPLLIGAELAVGVNQAPGTYTGTFDVDVVYQ